MVPLIKEKLESSGSTSVPRIQVSYLVGTHSLFKTCNENPFFHYSLSNRLLDPSNPSSNQEVIPINGPNDSKTCHTDQIPVQFQQKGAELSSLIVRTIKNQMISNPSGSCHQNHSGNSDEQLLTLNPVVALLFVVVVMSMWASKKVVVKLSGSPSKAAHVELICDKAFSNEDLSSQ
ncbi:hypothetical protein PPACK8108_LOCUS25800, partial [Phakopsora pachyrhizi]